MSEESSQPQTFIICPTCGGTGLIQIKRCSTCNGIGFGTFFGNSFLYCHTSLSTSFLQARALKKVGDKVISGVAYTIFIAGLVALGFWLYQQGLVKALEGFDIDTWLQLNFWSAAHPYILFFWLGALAALFTVYRYGRAHDHDHRIAPVSYSDTLQVASSTDWADIKKSVVKKINVVEGVDETVQTILEQAFLLAKKFNNSQITSLHVWAVSLFCSPAVATVMSRLSLDEEVLQQGISRLLNNLERGGGEPQETLELKEILIQAYTSASTDNRHKISALDIIMPCFDHNQKLNDFLYTLEVERIKLENAVLWIQFSEKLREDYQRYKRMATFKPSSNMDRAYTALATPLLDHFSYDWTLAAKWGRVEMCVERENEMKKIFDTVEKGQTGILLVGPFGVGKTAIVGGLAQRMVIEDVPLVWQDKRLIELDIARLLGGLSPDKAEERFVNVIEEVARARNIVLYIKDIEKIMGLGGGGEQSLDMTSVLADALSRGHLYCLASVTDENHRKYIESSLLSNIMATIDITEPDINQAIRMIETKIPFLESAHGVYFSYNAVAEVVHLTARYLHDQYLPAKAISVLESVSVMASRTSTKIVDQEMIAQAITELTHIPVTKLTGDESENLLHLEETLHKRVIGQDEAVTMVAAALRRARVELRDSKRPIANFLFLGPTGVGKTELAKAVSETYFGKEDYMIRLDMSEYQNSDSVNKMIGSPDGITGYLTDAVRRLPFTLILLDEIEKADREILNLFLQVMDEGRLTDGQGRTVDFSNSIIIATSNVGSQLIQEKVREGNSLESIKDQLVDDELTQVMRPELINRFDGVIVFRPLDQEQVVEITKLLLTKVKDMVEAKGYNLLISDKVIAEIARLGFQPEYGARPLRRVIQEKIEDVITTTLLAHKLNRRDTIIINDDLTVTIDQAPTI